MDIVQKLIDWLTYAVGWRQRRRAELAYALAEHEMMKAGLSYTEIVIPDNYSGPVYMIQCAESGKLGSTMFLDPGWAQWCAAAVTKATGQTHIHAVVRVGEITE